MKRTDNQSKFDALREEFSTFTFERQTVKRENGVLSLAFDFNLDDRYHFRPTLEIPARPFFDWDGIPEEQLQVLAFQIGMTELVSYWKIACPKRVVVKPYALTESQKAFWKKLYYNGLGEFLYLNNITVSETDLMEIESPLLPTSFSQLPMSFPRRTCESMEMRSIRRSQSMGSVKFEERTLVPVGGGKDSVVTLECLRKEMSVIPLIVNPRGATLNCVKTAGYKEDEFIVVNRTLDPTMLQLNAEGYLNGHTPFSALLAFISILVAFGSRSKYIALSNENSANESTVPGTNINHQYSKSIEFESDFRNYVAENLSDEVQYFSFLRPLSELQIAKLFSECEAYHSVFRSCNVGSKTDSWCGHCPKCLFTWIILSPFLSREKLTAIFGKDLMADESLQPILEELNGTAAVKPFECVGTVEEVRACINATAKVPETVPEPVEGVEGPTVEEILQRFNTKHFLPPQFEQILKTALREGLPIDSIPRSAQAGNDMGSRFDQILNRLRGKRILILGFGREGRSTLHFLNKYLPDAIVAVADKNEMEAVQYFGTGYLEAMYDYDIVIKTPGISLLNFDTKGVEITSQTDLFLSQFQAQTIGITGTKGKSTTTSLIYHLLKSSGRDAILTGNIGIPCFDVMEDIKPESIVVYELSAHQLEYVHNSPRVGVLLNIFEEHLDHFGTMSRYAAAKLNIMRYMGEDDTAVIHETLMEDAWRLFVNNIVFSLFDIDDLIERTALPLIGEHNLLNVKAALLACYAYGVDIRELIPHLYTFKPLEHRLEPVGTFDGVTFVNDSISTIPQAAISACQALGRVDFLLLGGFDRGIDYQPLVDYLKEHPVQHLLFTGKAGERMMEMIRKDGVSTGSTTCNTEVPEPVEGPTLFYYASMEAAFAYLSTYAQPGDVCLLSPAASSYDQYKNFEERGRKFKALAESFKRSL
ncbi:MAG: UDP-N-acetylmuramoyl-L-alanine--D-glutamate ligase [Bacteroidales bacterium]|nr:UDP-N-acetylmuramoyl-L-alanine--D-glutamate ligase [Bacteroidales bacterium]